MGFYEGRIEMASQKDRPLGLGKDLWDKLETAQGHSFVSDDMCTWADSEVLAFVNANLMHAPLEGATPVQMQESIHRAFHYVVSIWLQQQGWRSPR